MKLLRWFPVALLAAVPLSAQPPAVAAAAAAQQQKPAADRLSALQGEYESLHIGFKSRVKEVANDPKALEALQAELQTKTKAIFARAEALIAEDPRADLAVRTRIWFATEHYEIPKRKEWLDKVLAEDIGSPLLVELVPELDVRANPDGNAALEKLVEKSPHAKVRGMAMYALASNLGEQGKDAEILERGGKEAQNVRRRLGEARASDLVAAGSKPMEERRLALLERVIKEHPDLTDARGRKLASRAQGAINAIKHLKIGMIAPEIEGEEIDGSKLKLSDYRGKIVLLDFWGNW